MTRMIPAVIHPTVQSGAERKLFELIRDTSGTDDWICLHSLALARHEHKRKGEIDFLLLTRKGVFVLEAKGGRIARDGGAWIFTNRWGEQQRKYESPYDQASGAMFTLEKELQQHFGKDHRLAKILLGYGVLFPDITFEDYGTEGDHGNTYDIRDRAKAFTAFVERLAAYARQRDSRPRYAPSEKDHADLTAFFRGDFDRIPPLGVRLDDITANLVRLTEEQYAVLDAYDSPLFPRLVIQGGAGTGKTMLAVECAVREGLNAAGTVLFLCFNRLLAAYLNRSIQLRGLQEKVQVWSLYSFLTGIVKRSPLAQDFDNACKGATETGLYEKIIPEYAGLAALEDACPQFDTIVLDEGQDFLCSWLLPILGSMLKGGLEEGRWRVFCDVNNQGAVFGKYEDAALAQLLKFGNSTVLTLNRRNSREIAQETTMLTSPKVPSVGVTPGLPVEYIWCDSQAEQPKRLKSLLYRLYESGIAPGKITILTPRAFKNSSIADTSDPPLEPVTEQNVFDVVTSKHGTTTYSTVSAFKGLENDYIVLVDVESLLGEWWRSVIYVGMSRARAGLCVLVPRVLRSDYEDCLRRSLTPNVRQ